MRDTVVQTAVSGLKKHEAEALNQEKLTQVSLAGQIFGSASSNTTAQDLTGSQHAENCQYQRQNYQRWYDHEPTTSMAISLLQNRSHAEQRQIVSMVMNIWTHAQQTGLFPAIQPHNEATSQPLWKTMLNVRRWLRIERRNQHPVLGALLETMKAMPAAVRQAIATEMINVVYLMELGHDSEMLEALSLGELLTSLSVLEPVDWQPSAASPS